MKESPYSALLRDPRWQKKRLEVLALSGFACSSCKSSIRNIQVHHKKYRKGAMPWDYENDDLEALCDLCHELEHAQLTVTELELEQKIDSALESIRAAKTKAEKQSWFAAIKALISQRNPETVRKLELQKGIAK